MSASKRAQGITFLAVAVIAGLLGLGLWLSGNSRSPTVSVSRSSPAEPLPADTLALPGALALQPAKHGEMDGVGITRRGDFARRPAPDSPPDHGPHAVRESLRLTVADARASRTAPPEAPVDPAEHEDGSARAPVVEVSSTVVATAAGPARYAPFGRPLRCELVFTLESTNERTPIIALVTEDQWWNGELVIPAGTEAHGAARVDRSRDRVFSDEEWVLVLPRQEGRAHGRELVVHGLALDRDQPDAALSSWGLTDGSYGLRGRVLRNTDPEELKLFAATFLGAAASGLQETRSDAFGGRTVLATPANASLEGLRAVLTQVASRIEEEVRRNGSYLQVPAGKQFYLYLTQSLLPDEARVASLAPGRTFLRPSAGGARSAAPADGLPQETSPHRTLP